MIDLAKMLDEVKQKTGITDPKSIELLTRVIARGTELAARAGAGEDVEKEQFHLRAQVSNLGEAARRTTSQVIFEHVTAGIAAAINKALAV